MVGRPNHVSSEPSAAGRSHMQENDATDMVDHLLYLLIGYLPPPLCWA